jgi:Type I restriction modification DNA specificity domain
VWPLGAQVRRVTGSRDAPLSSQNTIAARRRRAAARILGPVLGHPTGDRPLVTLHRAAGGPQQPVVQPAAQQLPHVAAMVGDPGQPLDHGGHAVKGPVVVVEAMRAGTLAQRLVDAVQLLLGQPWGVPGRAAACKRLRSTFAPQGVPAADVLPGDAQLAGDLGLGVAGGKQRPGLHADAFEGLAVAQTPSVAAVGGWSHTAMLPAQPRSCHPKERTSLMQQRGIAAVLGALDDKMTVNLQLHGLSWKLAAAIYRQLIVQSNRAVSLGDAIELAYGKALPAKARVEGPVPVYGSGGVVGRHNVALVHGPGVVIGRKGTAGAVHWSHNPFYPIDTTFYVKPVRDLPMLFIYFALKSLDLENMNFDSAVPGLNRNAALAREIPLPEAPALESFAETTTPLIDCAASALYENELLARLRDVLLPRLLSGELRVREAEAAVGEAM